MLSAVIFDFDGVITDSEILHFRSFNEVLGGYGISISKAAYYESYLGLSDFDLFTLFIEEGRLKIGREEVGGLIARKNKLFEELASSEGHIISGVVRFVRHLREEGVPMAICSGALLSEIELILGDAGLRGYFETIVSADQVKRSKPDPEGFYLVLERLGGLCGKEIKARECVVIEDSCWGLAAAKKAGMRTVGVTNSYPAEKLSPCDMVVDGLDKLNVDVLNRLMA